MIVEARGISTTTTGEAAVAVITTIATSRPIATGESSSDLRYQGRKFNDFYIDANAETTETITTKATSITATATTIAAIATEIAGRLDERRETVDR